MDGKWYRLPDSIDLFYDGSQERPQNVPVYHRIGHYVFPLAVHEIIQGEYYYYEYWDDKEENWEHDASHWSIVIEWDENLWGSQSHP